MAKSKFASDLESLLNPDTGSEQKVRDFVRRKISEGDITNDDLPIIQNIAKTDLSSFFSQSKLSGENDPTPENKSRFRTTGNLTEGDTTPISPAFRKSFEASLNSEDTARIAVDRASKKAKTEAIDETARSIVDIRNLSTPEGQRGVARKRALSLREAVAKEMADEQVMETAYKSGDMDLFKKSLPVTRNADGEVTIKMTPTVQKLFKTPEGERAIKQAQRDFISEENAGASVRDELEREIEKADRESKKQNIGSGTFYDLFKAATNRQAQPKPKVIDIPETGEQVNVGDSKTVIGIYTAANKRQYKRFSDGSVQWL